MYVQKVYRIIFSSIIQIIGLVIKTDNNMILFNAHGKKYNDSPRAIFEFMIKKGLYKRYKFVWAVDSPNKYNIPYSQKVKMDTIKYFITALRAKYWVSCVNIERGLKFKKRETKYLNTW